MMNLACDGGTHGTTLKKVLHAEDDDSIRDIVRMSFELVGGPELFQCTSGEAAIAAAEDFGPDLFLMDVMMPGIGGIEAARVLRRLGQFRNTPLVFVTARATHNEVQYLKSEFSAEVITKPFDPLGLPQEVESLWSKCITPEVVS